MEEHGKKGSPWSSFSDFYGVSEGTRTLDNWGHNPVLYQLSYTHHIS